MKAVSIHAIMHDVVVEPHMVESEEGHMHGFTRLLYSLYHHLQLFIYFLTRQARVTLKIKQEFNTRVTEENSLVTCLTLTIFQLT